MRPTEIIAGCALLIGVSNALGFHRDSPGAAVAAESTARAQADTALHRGIDRNTSRIDSLTLRVESLDDRLLFTNYLQCEAARENHSALSRKAQADCDSIIQRRLAP